MEQESVVGARGLGGWGVKAFVKDWLGVIAQVAATTATPSVTAAVPRELRIDPREKKKSRKLRPPAPWSVGGRSRRRGSYWHTLHVLLRENRDEVLKKDSACARKCERMGRGLEQPRFQLRRGVCLSSNNV